MRRPLILGLLAGCSPLPPELFAESVESLRATRGSPARLTLDGPLLPADPSSTYRESALEFAVLDAEALRVVYVEAGVALAVYLAPEDTLDAITETGWHGPIWARSGEPIDVLELAGTSARIRLEDPRLTVDTWIDAGPIGPVYIEDSEAELDAPNGAPLLLPGASPIYTAPGGDVLGWTRAFSSEAPRLHWVAATETGRAEGDWLEVVIPSDRFSVKGWVEYVPTDGLAIGGKAWGRFGSSCSLGFARAHDTPTVWADTPLYSEPGGEVIGHTTRDLWSPIVAEAEGWLALETPSLWGDIEVWVHPHDI